jgi:tetratricopeptide (TPR) repeat protein
MAAIWAKIVVLGLAVCACSGQVSAQQPQDSPPPAVLPTLSPPPPPPWILFPQPDPLPSPPDAQMPDLGTLPGPPDKSKSRLKRAIDRMTPRCLDAITHTCWSSPPGEDSPAVSGGEREFAKDMEIGDFNFKDKNYRGAELRFRDALNYKPDQPDATFKLAESLNRLDKNDEAKQKYQAYLKVQPDGPYAERARIALQRLAKISAGKN